MKKTLDVLAKIGDFLRPLLLLVVRLYWGWQFFLTGKGKLLHLARTEGFFASLHLPAPAVTAAVVGATECAGGILLLLGLGSRLVAPILAVEMVAAYATAEPDALHAIFSDPDKFLGADPFLFLFASLLVFIFGAGAISLDAAFGLSERKWKA